MGRHGMIRQEFEVEVYWKVIVYWNVDYNFFDSIYKDLRNIGFSKNHIRELMYDMGAYKAKAVTCSNLRYHTSVVLFNRHGESSDYLNSIVHESEHIKQAMLKAYSINDSGEPPAYTIGYLVMRMYSAFRSLL